jgi:prepilin-type N-terminal cleavage/methylation domain-containing protein
MNTIDGNIKSGFTLIEVLISALIIGILVIGGAAALHHAGSSVAINGKKRIALAIANQRMELARANPYIAIAPGKYDEDDTYFLIPSKTDPNTLVVSVDDSFRTIKVGDITYKMRTKVLRHSKNAGTIGFDTEALQITVSVEYRSSTGDRVELTTLLLPPGVAI